MMNARRLLWTGCAALAAAVVAGMSAQPTIPIDPTPRRPPDPVTAGKAAKFPRLIALKLHADWCPSCKAMGTLFEDLGRKFDAEPVLFVRLDLTDQRGRSQAEYMVASLGIGKLWTSLGEGKTTGQIVLIDPTGKSVVQTIPHDAEWAKAEKMLADSIKK